MVTRGMPGGRVNEWKPQVVLILSMLLEGKARRETTKSSATSAPRPVTELASLQDLTQKLAKLPGQQSKHSLHHPAIQLKNPEVR